MINILSFFLLFLNIINSNVALNNHIYKKFKNYMNKNLGSVFKVNYGSSQYGSSMVEKGEILFESYDNFIFDNSEQRIVFRKNFIKTINKKNKQIIYDEPLVDELTIFDFLFSKNHIDHFNEIVSDSIYSTFNFELELFNYLGSLKVRNTTGEPKMLTLKSNDSSTTSYIIFENISQQQKFSEVFSDTLDFELIDFRE
jgi:hypothetical protein